MPENNLIRSLSEKIDLLMEDNRRAHGENQKLRKAEEKLNSDNRKLKGRIAELEQRIKIFEVGDAISGGNGDTKQAKARINRLMREIDKCIALMNR